MKHRWITDRGLWLESRACTLGLKQKIEAAALPEVEAVVPGDGSLLVVLQPGQGAGPVLLDLINKAQPDASLEVLGRHHEIPVIYGGDAGPDLERVADAAGLTTSQAVELHAGAQYRVAFLGFQPGFAYLAGTPTPLQTARRSAPRARVPAGSVALGGMYTGIYPGTSPGGWLLIGRTREWVFDPLRKPPARFTPGDHVRFVPR
ncbi:MAG TPA: 5-oxoprolinase subunit PxpB [Thiobacillaceae bacterium]|nr:5-oxoprolinase subunit PxpB [Thiobacillaceae bacterium]